MPKWVQVVLALVVGAGVGIVLNLTVGPLPSPWNWLMLLGTIVVIQAFVVARGRRRDEDNYRI